MIHFLASRVVPIRVFLMDTLLPLSLCAFLLLVPVTVKAEEEDVRPQLERIRQTLVPPPAVPSHEQSLAGLPRVVEVRLVVEEK